MKRLFRTAIRFLGLDSQTDPAEDQLYQKTHVRLRPNRFWVTILPAIGLVLFSYLIALEVFRPPAGGSSELAAFAFAASGGDVAPRLGFYPVSSPALARDAKRATVGTV